MVLTFTQFVSCCLQSHKHIRDTQTEGTDTVGSCEDSLLLAA